MKGLKHSGGISDPLIQITRGMWARCWLVGLAWLGNLVNVKGYNGSSSQCVKEGSLNLGFHMIFSCLQVRMDKLS